MEKVPSRDECLYLLAAAGCSESVIAHTIAVCELALDIAESINKKNPQLVSIPHIEAGALLHDIGRSACHSVHHACAGAAICRSHTIDKRVCAIVLNHIGAGIPASEAALLGLPVADYIPVTLEEKIVANADNLVAGTKIITVQKRIKSAKQNGLHPRAIKRIKNLYTEIEELCCGTHKKHKKEK
jgi:uncharacterized protein